MKRYLAAVAVLMLSMPPSALHAEVVKVGFPTCLSGSGAVYGKMTSNAVKMAVDEVNSEGAAGQHKLEVIIADGKCSPREATLAAEKLVISDRVAVLLGGVASSASLAVKAIAERENVPMLEGVAGNNSLTQRGNTNIFRVVPNSLMYVDFSTDYLCNTVKVKTAAFVFQNTDFGRDSVDLSRVALEKCGVKVVGWYPAGPDENNFQTTITDLKSKKPDVVYLIHWVPPAISFLRQASEAGFKSIYFNTGSLAIPSFTNEAGSLAEGFVAVDPFEPTSNRPDAKIFTENYRKRFGMDPDWFAAGYYTCVKVLADAVKRGGTTSEAIRKALQETKDLPTVLGPISFDDTGQSSSLFTLFEFTNGKRELKLDGVKAAPRFLATK